MFKILELCGKDSYLARFKLKIDMNLVKDVFEDFKIIEESENRIKMCKNNKVITIFSSGEVYFYGFDKEEVEEICSKISEKCLKK